MKMGRCEGRKNKNYEKEKDKGSDEEDYVNCNPDGQNSPKKDTQIHSIRGTMKMMFITMITVTLKYEQQ